MNENEKTTPVEKPLDETRKAALLRYLGVMFVVAFVFVLISMIGELRDKQATILELDSSSSSALTKVEQLQDDNRQLIADNAYLTGRIEELEKQLDELEQDLADSKDLVSQQSKEIADLELDLMQTIQEAAALQAALDALQQPVTTEE